MCNQSVGLIAAELERQGIATVCIALVRSIAERLCPPRALIVPFPFGYPLDRPNRPEAQLRVMRTALRLLGHPGPPPALDSLVPD